MRWFCLIMLCAASGCAPEIGDDCESSIDCSVNSERICDTASPGGYCTIANCDADTCPEDAVCVEFRFNPERLASRWCMASCEDGGDCRGGDYGCVRASQYVDEGGEPLARVLDHGRDGRKFCAVK